MSWKGLELDPIVDNCPPSPEDSNVELDPHWREGQPLRVQTDETERWITVSRAGDGMVRIEVLHEGRVTSRTVRPEQIRGGPTPAEQEVWVQVRTFARRLVKQPVDRSPSGA